MDVIAHYDKLIDENNDPFRDTPALQEYMNKWDGQAFIASMRLDNTKKVLEIGVGTGRLAAKVSKHCFHFTGIDISPKTIDRAKENLSNFSNIELICSDFTQYIFNEKFDVIYSSLTMMHFEDKHHFIEKVDSLLYNGGIFCLSIDKSQGDYIEMGTRKIKIYPDSLDSIISLVKTSNMNVIDCFQTEFAHIIVCTKDK